MSKWGLRVIRLTALALIAFPEPVTTGIGIATLVGSSLLKRKREYEVLKRFELVLREHLIRTRHLEYIMSINNYQPEIVRHNPLNINTGMLSGKYIYENSFESRTPERLTYRWVRTPLLVHNTIKSLPQPYSYGSPDKHGIHHNELVPSEKVVHHKLDIKQLSSRYQLGEFSRSVNQKKETTKTSIYHHLPELPGFATGTGFKRNTQFV